jgi:hypothetical protein
MKRLELEHFIDAVPGNRFGFYKYNPEEYTDQ